MSALLGLTWQQQAALRCIAAEGGEAAEDTIALEGISRPSNVCCHLEEKGFAEKGDWEQDAGHHWKLTALARAHLLPLLFASNQPSIDQGGST